jgi:Cu/Zn superoxide dismutase
VTAVTVVAVVAITVTVTVVVITVMITVAGSYGSWSSFHTHTLGQAMPAMKTSSRRQTGHAAGRARRD